jgi:hypothetical protein
MDSAEELHHNVGLFSFSYIYCVLRWRWRNVNYADKSMNLASFEPKVSGTEVLSLDY